MRAMLVCVVCVLSCGCTMVSPDAGTEAVLVKKPWIFGHGGVDQTPVTPGLTWAAFSTWPVYVDKRPMQFSEHFNDMMSREGVPLDFNAVVRLQVLDSVALVSKFGNDKVQTGPETWTYAWYWNNLHKPIENAVRQAVRKHGMNETAISTVAIEEIDAEVSQAITAYIKEFGLPVRLVDMTVGRANPPDAVKNQRIATAEQEQRANTERQRKLAEDQRMEAERARAASDNAYRNAMQLDPQQFLQLENIKALRDVCAKGGCTFIAGQVAPVLEVRR